MGRIKPDCVCYYCLKRKEGRCGLMSNRVKKCKLFIYVEGKSSGVISVSLRAAKMIDSIMKGNAYVRS